MQSNMLADLSFRVKDDFKEAVQEMKEESRKNGWIIPTLQANMRNQVNIANIKVERGNIRTEMQDSIEKLKSGSSLVGEVPLLFKVKDNDWDKKKGEVLKHCIELMNRKSDKNVVVLFDWFMTDVTNDIKRVMKDKKVVAYPSKQDKEEGISNVKDFVEKDDHILVTEVQYFNGCEAPNIIFLSCSRAGLRNCFLRGVQNVITIQLTDNQDAELKGMKVDDRFL